MKNIAKFLAPFAILTFLGSLMISSICLLVAILASVGFAEDLPMSYLMRLNLPAISVALPAAGMIIFAVITLGFRTRVDAINPARVEEVTEPVASESEVVSESEKEEH